MTDSVAPQIAGQWPGEKRVHTIDFGDSAGTSDLIDGKLDSGELLTGTPTAVNHSISPTSGTSGTIADVAINTVSLSVNGRTCIAGECVQFSFTGGTSGTINAVKITATSDATPAQTMIGIVRIRVKAVST